jgi:hypothetical protein
MLKKVREQRPTYNNNARITTSVSVSRLKLLYYSFFAKLYTLVGFCADSVLVNSSWTKSHIEGLWRLTAESRVQDEDLEATTVLQHRRLSLVYPPCNTLELQNMTFSMDAKMQALRKTHKKWDDMWQSQVNTNKSVTNASHNRVLFTANDPVEEIIQSMCGHRLIISVGQFRPEKDHLLQIR